LFLYILPTEQCNFRCVYCYEKFRDVYMNTHIQDSIIQYVHNNITKFKVIRVEWFGGEPLLALDVVVRLSNAIIKICRENGVLYHAVMTTNAYSMDLDVFKVLKKCRILSYQITVDGLKETHDTQRPLRNGGGTFDRIMENLQAISKHIKTQALDVTLRVNVSRKLAESMNPFLDYLKNALLDDPRFTISLTPVGSYGQDEGQMPTDICCNDEDITNAIRYCKDIGVSIAENTANLNVGGQVCYACKNNSWVIGADGKIYKCTVILYNNENVVGQVGDDGEFIIYEDKLGKWVQSGIQHGLDCTSCSIRPICLEGVCYKRIVLNEGFACENMLTDVHKSINLLFS